MLIDDFKAYSKPCFRDCAPPCVSACPLGLDVKAVIDKVQRKNFTAAYRLYRNHVLFPAVVSRICHEPCREKCVRVCTDQAIYLKKIEAACVAYTKESKPVAFNVPEKSFTIAVIGAGLSGLSCALKLASRNYKVKIYEKSAQWGGRLWSLLPPEIFLPELETQFSALRYEFFPSHLVTDLSEYGADAVYIATGRNGNDFGANGVNGPPGVFLGGGLLGANPIEALAQGVAASFAIETFVKTGAMPPPAGSAQAEACTNNFYSLPLLPAASLAGETQILSAEEAVTESERCPRCNCSLCRDNCEMMRHFKTIPPKMTTDAIASVGSKENITSRVGMKMINACFQCGLCKEICPENVDMENCLLDARRIMHREQVLPPAYHDFWLRDMRFSCHDAYLAYMPQDCTTSSRLFFPGCQLGASDPAYVLRTYAFLSEKYPDLSLALSCCGVPADWAGDEELRDAVLKPIIAEWERLGRPTIILACPTCRKTFSKYLPQAETVSLYEVLAEMPNLPGLREAGQQEARQKAVSIYDPCSSRGDPRMRKSLRRLCSRYGVAVEEMPHSGSAARCCGFGGHTHAVCRPLVDAVVEQRIAATENEYITYCTNCRDTFAVSGKACRHILDILFTKNSAFRKPPTLSQRRINRLSIKAAFSAMAGETPVSGKKESSMNLVISDELADKMDRLFILEDEVRTVIEHCETTGKKLRDAKTGHFTGHLQIGIITYWVTYAVESEGLRLLNTYYHRMSIDADARSAASGVNNA